MSYSVSKRSIIERKVNVLFASDIKSGAVYVNDAYGDTIYNHLQYAGTYVTDDIRMAYMNWS